MSLPAFAHKSCCSSPAAMSRPDNLPRPRGLWKARGTTHPRLATTPDPPPKKRQSPTGDHDDPRRFYTDDHRFTTDDDDNDNDSDSSTFSRKRRRVSDSPPTSEDSRDEVLYWDYSRKCSPHPERLSKWTTRTKVMDTSTTISAGEQHPNDERMSCDLEDWEDLKELFAKAAEMYESQEPRDVIPLLRGVIHECHRFMRFYQDPSVLFATQPQPERQPRVLSTPPEERTVPDWLAEHPPHSSASRKKRDQGLQTGSPAPSSTTKEEKKCKCKDLPTAFHTIFGTTLFFFGNLIAQEPELALEGEPTLPTPYWLAALDVFEIGENLPIKTSGRGCQSAPEDWRMAIVWGRTLICIADEVLSRQKTLAADPGAPQPAPQPTFNLGGMPAMPAFGSMQPSSPDEPNWPPESPFALIAARRPPVTRRLSLATVTPHELLMLAQDQFSRGIFHMPHPQHLQPSRYQRSAAAAISPAIASFPQRPPPPSITTAAPTSSSGTGATASSSSGPSSKNPAESFSRAKELYTIGSEVLILAEKLEGASERQEWAHWADSVFSQMKMESDMDAWRGPIASARGRSCLVMGSARAEELEVALERGEMEVLGSEDAEDAREALRAAVGFLERAREVYASQRQGADGEKENVVMLDTTDDDDGTTASTVAEEDVEYDVVVETPSTAGAGAEHEMGDEEGDVEELKTLLAEALLTLANLTADPKEREELYAKAQRVGGGSFELDELDDRMDESG